MVGCMRFNSSGARAWNGMGNGLFFNIQPSHGLAVVSLLELLQQLRFFVVAASVARLSFTSRADRAEFRTDGLIEFVARVKTGSSIGSIVKPKRVSSQIPWSRSTGCPKKVKKQISFPLVLMSLIFRWKLGSRIKTEKP